MAWLQLGVFMKGFEPPDFENDEVRSILKKSWQAFEYKIDELWNEMKEVKDRHAETNRKQDKTNVEVAGIHGQLSIIIKMGAGALALLVAVLVAIINLKV